MRVAAFTVAASIALAGGAAAQEAETGNVIFFHPDGASATHWTALRIFQEGPDGALNWDRLPEIGVYTGHVFDGLTGSSHGGATIHAYGVKVVRDSFGLNGDQPITAASGQTASIMEEAQAAGRAVGLVQTGDIGEPGTAAFLATVESRSMAFEIASQVLAAGPEVMMAGGERLLLPDGVEGRHGPGERTDGRNLIEEAEAAGYTVVYTAEELAALDLSQVDRLFGVFAHDDTFNDNSEEENAEAGLGFYVETAPDVATMTEAALEILSRDSDGFFLVVEEEGTDNMANSNNASGTLEALSRADAAIGVMSAFIAENPDTLMVMASDSNAGGMTLVGPSAEEFAELAPNGNLPPRMRNGAALDGVNGTGTEAFTSAPDANGTPHRFGISWSGFADVSGGILVRAEGLNADKVGLVVDNTDIYKLMYYTLFGEELE